MLDFAFFLKGQCHAIWVECQYSKNSFKKILYKQIVQESFTRTLLEHWIHTIYSTAESGGWKSTGI